MLVGECIKAYNIVHASIKILKPDNPEIYNTHTIEIFLGKCNEKEY